MRSGQCGVEFAAGQEARIEQLHGLKPIERCAVVCHMVSLSTYRFWPFEAEPSEVCEDRGLKFTPTPSRIYVFNAKQKMTAAPPRFICGK